ncbi:MAG: DUF1273 domain-containing protein [Chitinophagales bacterium]|nr:DUF1273 domain-containing protein [Chitinophagales bacterium]
MNKAKKIIGFTGPRRILPNSETYKHVCKETEKILKDIDPEYCISGVALGYDQYAAFVCNKNNIPWIAAIPFIGQENLWQENQKKIYYSLLSKAKEQVIVCEGGYAAWKLMKRNVYIVDNCDILIAAYYDGLGGGTENCVNYARMKNKEIIYIDFKDIL